MPSKPKKVAKSPPSTLRIIAGRWRGRKISFTEVAGLRPTGDRIRETVFNWLAPDLPGSRCLDLFAGSGVLGLEALSRGARQVTFIEQNPVAAGQLSANVKALQAEGATVYNTDALAWLRQPRREDFDIVFLDPPFSANLWAPVCESLNSGNWLAEGSLIYLESSVTSAQVVPTCWQPLREKTSGQVRYALYRKETSVNSTR